MKLSERLAAARTPDETPPRASGADVRSRVDQALGTRPEPFATVPIVFPVPEAAPVDVPDARPTTPVATPAPVEPHRWVDPLADIKRTVHQSLLDVLGPTLYDAEVDETELAERVLQTLQQVIESDDVLINTADRRRITAEVSDEILGHGPLEPFLRDPEVSEIMVNGFDRIYVERAGRLHAVPAAFADDNHLRRTIDKIVGRIGRRIDESSPMVDARLPDGSRVNAVIPPVSLDGPP